VSVRSTLKRTLIPNTEVIDMNPGRQQFYRVDFDGLVVLINVATTIAGVTLSATTRLLVAPGAPPPPGVLNRALLQDTFPDQIPPRPDRRGRCLRSPRPYVGADQRAERAAQQGLVHSDGSCALVAVRWTTAAVQGLSPRRPVPTSPGRIEYASRAAGTVRSMVASSAGRRRSRRLVSSSARTLRGRCSPAASAAAAVVSRAVAHAVPMQDVESWLASRTIGRRWNARGVAPWRGIRTPAGIAALVS
jgi:hypothetical protein